MKETIGRIERVRAEFQLISEIRDNNGILIKQLDPNFIKFPSKKRREDAGYDLFSAEEGTIQPWESKTFHTGVRLSVPYGWFYEVKGRSGLGFNNINPFIATIDATYSGLLIVLLSNSSNKEYVVNKGDRIAQILFHKQYEMEPIEVEKFSPEYNKRGLNGFGSSGK